MSKYLITPRRHGPSFLGPRMDEEPGTANDYGGRAVNMLQPERRMKR